MSQRELAAALKMTISQVSRIEGGHRMPPLDTFLKIAQTIGAAPGALLKDLAP